MSKKRFVDANALLAGICKDCGNGCDLENSYCLLATEIMKAPTVDAVEVPCRCKECKYWKHFDHLGCTEFVRVCTLAYYMIGENGYCLYGERREGE